MGVKKDIQERRKRDWFMFWRDVETKIIGESKDRRRGSVGLWYSRFPNWPIRMLYL